MVPPGAPAQVVDDTVAREARRAPELGGDCLSRLWALPRGPDGQRTWNMAGSRPGELTPSWNRAAACWLDDHQRAAAGRIDDPIACLTVSGVAGLLGAPSRRCAGVRTSRSGRAIGDDAVRPCREGCASHRVRRRSERHAASRSMKAADPCRVMTGTPAGFGGGLHCGRYRAPSARHMPGCPADAR